MPGPSAKILADSITAEGHRLTSFEVTFHRFILAEVNTHRTASRNSASSRAIPLLRKDGRGTLDRFDRDLAYPVVWASEKPGMQGGPPLEGGALQDAMALWDDLRLVVSNRIRNYVAEHPIDEPGQVRLHKSLLNRWLEPGQWHTAIISGTCWDNLFHQRVSPLAQPEFDAVAEMMLNDLAKSEPVELGQGQYHLPYIEDEDRYEAVDRALRDAHANEDRARFNALKFHIDKHPVVQEFLVQVSAARCARTSYMTQDGRRDMAEDIVLYRRLVEADPMHASPLEHPATPESGNQHWVKVSYKDKSKTLLLPKYGNFIGYRQHRMEVEIERDYQSYS